MNNLNRLPYIRSLGTIPLVLGGGLIASGGILAFRNVLLSSKRLESPPSLEGRATPAEKIPAEKKSWFRFFSDVISSIFSRIWGAHSTDLSKPQSPKNLDRPMGLENPSCNCFMNGFFQAFLRDEKRTTWLFKNLEKIAKDSAVERSVKDGAEGALNILKEWKEGSFSQPEMLRAYMVDLFGNQGFISRDVRVQEDPTAFFNALVQALQANIKDFDDEGLFLLSATKHSIWREDSKVKEERKGVEESAIISLPVEGKKLDLVEGFKERFASAAPVRTKENLMRESSYKIGRLPSSLCLSVARLHSLGNPTKNQELSIYFTDNEKLEIDLEEIEKGALYTLKSFEVHRGTSFGSGHYYTYTRREEGGWWRCDDSRVSYASDAEVKGIMVDHTAETPYLMVFDRIPFSLEELS